jgi:hypothetical protein
VEFDPVSAVDLLPTDVLLVAEVLVELVLDFGVELASALGIDVAAAAADTDTDADDVSSPPQLLAVMS